MTSHNNIRRCKCVNNEEVNYICGNGLDVNVAVVHGSSNVPEMMERIKSGNKNYHFIEFMACTGGCIGGPCSLSHEAKDFIKEDKKNEDDIN